MPFKEFLMPIGIEVMGGAVTFFLIVYFWDHPHEKENTNRIENVLYKLEQHRNFEAAHIRESTQQMEEIKKLIREKSIVRQNIPEKQSSPKKLLWFLFGAVFSLVGAILFITQRR